MRALVFRLIFVSVGATAIACGGALDSPTAPPENTPTSLGKSTDAGADVMLDVRPWMCPNRMTRHPWGVLNAALVGTEDLDVRNIDVSSVRLEGVAPAWNYRWDVTGPGDCCGGTDGSVIRVNAGGSAVAGDPDWTEDTASNKSPWVNTGFAVSGSEVIDMSHPSIPAGTPMSLFQSERYDGVADPDMVWDIPVPNGEHTVRLYFVDRYPPAHRPGGRLFDVTIEGQLRLDDYDIFLAAGAGFAGVVEELTTTVGDGSLTIEFGRNVQNPTISAIEIISGSGTGQIVVPERDGIQDLVLAFRKRSILEALGPLERGDRVELTLSGRLRDGTPFSDSDCVIIGFGDWGH